jgi:hypothetical protein
MRNQFRAWADFMAASRASERPVRAFNAHENHHAID